MTTPSIATTASTPAPAASALFLFGDGFEEGCLPDFRATTAAQAAEEARILSVTMSRARHGLVLSFARSVPEQSGRARQREPSRLLRHFAGVREGEPVVRPTPWPNGPNSVKTRGQLDVAVTAIWPL